MNVVAGTPPGRRLPRAERREQILAAATSAFSAAGFEDTGLDDVAAAAGISRAILYRHFESKADLYRAVLERARARLQAAVGDPPYTERIIDDLLTAAAGDPDGFRLLFHHAAREPAFRAEVDVFTAEMTATAHDHLAPFIPDPAWARWAARLAPAVTVAAVLTWLEAGQPEPAGAAARLRQAVQGISLAAGAEPVRTPRR
ncbi:MULTISPECIES: TetR/AcrR family transcriptional regulator [unclassified Modestobacter]